MEFNERGVLLVSAAFPEALIKGEQLAGEPLADVGEHRRRELVEARFPGLGHPNNGAAAALYQDDVVGIDTAIRRPAMHAEARFDRLSSIEDRGEEGLYKDREVDPDADFTLPEDVV